MSQTTVPTCIQKSTKSERSLIDIDFDELEAFLKRLSRTSLQSCIDIATVLLHERTNIENLEPSEPHLPSASYLNATLEQFEKDCLGKKIAWDQDFSADAEDPLKIIETKQTVPVSRKPRLRWTYEETCILLKGLNIYGPGKWALISSMPGLNKSNTQVKDRFSNLIKHGHIKKVNDVYVFRDKYPIND